MSCFLHSRQKRRCLYTTRSRAFCARYVNPRRFKVVSERLESQRLSKSAQSIIPVRWRLFFSDGMGDTQGINSPYSMSCCLRELANSQLAGEELLLGVSTPLPNLLLSAFLCRMLWGQRGQAQMLLAPDHTSFQHSQS